MEAGIFKVQVDFGQLQDAINDAVDQAIQRHALKSSLPPILTKQQLMDLLDVGATKAGELLNREDFPVIREFGHPRVPTHSLMIWIDEHTEWIRDNVGGKSKVKGKGRVA